MPLLIDSSQTKDKLVFTVEVYLSIYLSLSLMLTALYLFYSPHESIIR